MKDYYNGSSCLELIDTFLNKLKLEGSLAFYTGNIIKYIYRYDNKDKEKDLDKAIDYINLLFHRARIALSYDTNDLIELNNYISALKLTKFKKEFYFMLLLCILKYNAREFILFSGIPLKEMIEKERSKYEL